MSSKDFLTVRISKSVITFLKLNDTKANAPMNNQEEISFAHTGR